jgi:hypothetical protein
MSSIVVSDIKVISTREQMQNVVNFKNYLLNLPQEERTHLIAVTCLFFQFESEHVTEDTLFNIEINKLFSYLFIHNFLSDNNGIININKPHFADVWVKLIVNYSSAKSFQDFIRAYINA